MEITLSTAPTPNGWKISIALEEMGLPYDVRVIDFATNEQKSDRYLQLNPNGRIPTMVDDGFALFDQGDEALRHVLMKIADQAFTEDRLMIEAQQRVIDGAPTRRVLPTSADKGDILYNRLVEALAAGDNRIIEDAHA